MIDADLNMEIRADILEYSLYIETLINNLLLLNLGIFDGKESTKLFSNKGKLTFQNKIDLLFDIEVLSKDQNLEFVLFMNIRNKFLHDLECNSFQVFLSKLDSGLVTRFKTFLENEELICNENACEIACNNLFKKNIVTIKNKIKAQEKILKFHQLSNNNISLYLEFIRDLIENISITIENSELENPKVVNLGLKIMQVLEGDWNKFNEERKKFDFKEFHNSDEIMKSVFRVKSRLFDLPK